MRIKIDNTLHFYIEFLTGFFLIYILVFIRKNIYVILHNDTPRVLSMNYAFMYDVYLITIFLLFFVCFGFVVFFSSIFRLFFCEINQIRLLCILFFCLFVRLTVASFSYCRILLLFHLFLKNTCYLIWLGVHHLIKADVIIVAYEQVVNAGTFRWMVCFWTIYAADNVFRLRGPIIVLLQTLSTRDP